MEDANLQMIQQLKDKFREITENLDNVHDQKELLRLSELAKLSTDTIGISSKSTHYVHTDSDSGTKK